MLQIGEVLHAGITVRDSMLEKPLRSEKATREAANRQLNPWQENQARLLPEGASFSVFERITPYTGYATVTRYLTVVEG